MFDYHRQHGIGSFPYSKQILFLIVLGKVDAKFSSFLK